MGVTSRFSRSVLKTLFPATERMTRSGVAFRLTILGLLLAYSRRYFTIALPDLGEDPGWFHGVHLAFHEAGHVLFALCAAPGTLVAFMGSGFQVLVPLMIAGAFLFRNRDSFGAALGLWWAGHALLDVAPYIADARALEMPLLGGVTGQEVEGHDWEYLLSCWDALPLDTQIAGQVAWAARILMASAFSWAALSVAHDRILLADSKAAGPSAPRE